MCSSDLVQAELRWQDQKIRVPDKVAFDVVTNPDYSPFGMFELSEATAIVVAIAFAIATAMSTQYTWTFGTFSDYLKMFLWAAGAGTGGNLFKQLGATSAPGGQADATLVAAGARAGA